MQKTELKHWRNGLSIRGGYFKQYALQIGKIGIILSNKKPFINLYILK